MDNVAAQGDKKKKMRLIGMRQNRKLFQYLNGENFGI